MIGRAPTGAHNMVLINPELPRYRSWHGACLCRGYRHVKLGSCYQVLTGKIALTEHRPFLGAESMILIFYPSLEIVQKELLVALLENCVKEKQCLQNLVEQMA